MEKKQLRIEMKQKRAQMSANDCVVKSRRIAEFVYESEVYLRASHILIYMHYENEVYTDEIIEHSLKLRKHVFVPRVSGKDMEFYEITALSDCREGFRGIPEPKEGCMCFADYRREYPLPDKRDVLMIVPGLAFDTDGNRIGYGGGYYDRYLTGFSDCITMGICYDFQCRNPIEADEFDRKVDLVITEKFTDRQ